VTNRDDLVRRGILPRPEFKTCPGCEMPRSCGGVRHCCGNPSRPREEKPLSVEDCERRIVEAQRVLDDMRRHIANLELSVLLSRHMPKRRW
jgi:hypothetical protein